MEELKLKEGHVILSNIAKSPLYNKQIVVKTEAGTLSTPSQPSSANHNGLLNSKNKIRLNTNDSTSEKRKGRGRPLGSLNKPKDPNSPKKSA